MNKSTLQNHFSIKKDESHLWVNTILNSIKDSFFSIDSEYRYTSFNKCHASRMKEIYNADIQIGHKLSEYQTVKRDWERSKINLDKALSGEQFVEFGFSGEPEHKRLYFEVSHSPIVHDNGEIIGASVFSKEITERKQTEDALLETEKKYIQLVDNSPDAIAIYSDGKIVFINNECLRLIGASKPEELIGKSAIEFVHPDFRQLANKRMKAVIKKGEILPLVSEKFIRLDGSTIDVEVKSIPIVFEEKNAVQLIVRDITEQKNTEIALLKSEEKYRTLFKNNTSVMLIIDPDTGQILDANSTACEFYGWTYAELCKKQITEINTLSSEEILDIMRDAKLKGKKHFHFIHRKSNGELCDVEVYSTPIYSENSVYLYAIIHDISERIQAQKALNESEDKFKKAFITSPDSININRMADGTYISINKGFTRILGYSEEDILGKTSIEKNIWVDPSDRNKLVQGLIENGFVENLVAQFRTKTGELVFGMMSASVIELDGVKHILSITRDVEKLKQAEKALQESEEKFRKIFATSPEAISIARFRDGVYIDVNLGFTRITGYDAVEVLGKKPEDINIWYNQNERKILLCELKNNGIVENFVTRLQTKSGELIYGMMSSTIIELDGELYLLSITRDISEIKKVELALNESNERLNLILESNPIAIWDWDLKTDKWFATQKYYTMLGYDSETGFPDRKIWLEKVHPDDRKLIEDQIKNVLENHADQYSYDARMLHENGTYQWQTVFGNVIEYDTTGTPSRMLGVRIDIDERKRAEAALQESEEKLNTLFSSMTEMVAMHELVFNEQGEAIDYRIIDCNNAFSKITGIRKEDAVGKLATEVYQTEPAPYLEIYCGVGTTGESYEFNSYYAPLDRHFLISVVSTKKNCFSTITSDITDIQRFQELIIEKNKELESYLYVASHDLRSPLINIQGFSQRMQKQSDEIKAILSESKPESEKKVSIDKITNESMPKTLNFILSNVSKMETLINSLLQISRNGRLMLVVIKVDMNQLVNKIVAAHNYQIAEASAQIIIQDLHYCYGDENQLNQLFSNIIDNALKYRNPDRQLIIEIASEIQYNKVIYTISDNGIGINSRNIEKIWDVFYRVDPESIHAGEGIGLSIAKRITNKHKGKIWVESEEGQGSVFFIELQKNEFSEQ